MTEPKNEDPEKIFEDLIAETLPVIRAGFRAGPEQAAAAIKLLVTGLNGVHDYLAMLALAAARGEKAGGPGKN